MGQPWEETLSWANYREPQSRALACSALYLLVPRQLLQSRYLERIPTLRSPDCSVLEIPAASAWADIWFCLRSSKDGF